MAHLRTVSETRRTSAPAQEVQYQGGMSPILADAKTDMINSIYMAFQDYRFAKKTATPE
jgi:hypothetical protein